MRKLKLRLPLLAYRLKVKPLEVSEEGNSVAEGSRGKWGIHLRTFDIF